MDCMVRELKEEAHLEVLPEDLKSIVSYQPNLGFSSSKMHIFMAKVSKNRIKYNRKENNEDVYGIVWMMTWSVILRFRM